MQGLRRVSWRFAFAALAFAATLGAPLTACGGGSTGAAAALPPLPPPPPAKKGKYFKHVVIVVQENRSFDNLFATFPGADGTTVGKTHDGKLPLREADLNTSLGTNHSYLQWIKEYDGGKMDGFDLVPPGTAVYEYVNPAQIAPYWKLAQEYVLSDHTFQTQGSGSFTAHQDLIRGGTEIGDEKSLIDFPTLPPWGCDAPPGTVTSLITADNRYLSQQGPRPCLTYRTLRDLLDAKDVSWRYYTPSIATLPGQQWNAFEAIAAVRNGPQWTANDISPEKRVFTDINRDTLPAVSWIIPDAHNSDHPREGSDTGPSWVSQIVNAIGQSPAWDTTAIIIVWDDWGGWYDHVAPPGPRHYGGLGFRVPMIVVAPYAKAGYISHRQYEFGSIVRFVEDNWSLGRLGTTDGTSADFVNDFFDFSQKPRKFVTIQARYSQSYFLHQRPSGQPVDDE
jgi:phospholipase C